MRKSRSDKRVLSPGSPACSASRAALLLAVVQGRRGYSSGSPEHEGDQKRPGDGTKGASDTETALPLPGVIEDRNPAEVNPAADGAVVRQVCSPCLHVAAPWAALLLFGCLSIRHRSAAGVSPLGPDRPASFTCSSNRLPSSSAHSLCRLLSPGCCISEWQRLPRVRAGRVFQFGDPSLETAHLRVVHVQLLRRA